MAEKVKKSYLYNLAFQLLTLFLPLVTTPYVSRVLGSEGVGTFGFTYSVVSYFVIFGELGTFLYGRREIAYKRENKKSRSEAFWQINIIHWIAISISLFAYYLICMNNKDYGLYYGIFAGQIISSALDISWYFQGLEQFKAIAIRNMIIKLISVALIFIFVKTPDDLGLYIVFFCGSSLISNLTLWVLVPKTLSKVKIKFTDLKKHMAPVFSMFLPQIVSEVYTVLDKTMLGLLVNDMNEVGIYEQSQKLEKFSLSAITAIGPVMASRVANLYSNNKKDEIKERLKKSFHFVWFSATPVALGIAGIASTLVPWFLGDQFLGAIPVMQIGCLLIFALALSNTIGQQFLVPTGRQKFFTASIIAGAVTNLALNLIMIPTLKATGAIIASVAAESAVALVQLLTIRKTIPIREIIKPFYKCIFSGILMLIVVILLGNILPATAVGTFTQIIVGAIVYVVSMTVLKDKIMLEIWEMVKNILNKIF